MAKGFFTFDEERLLALSEDTLPSFFPRLLKSFIYRGYLLELRRDNRWNKKDIDFSIRRDKTPIAYLDNEQRFNSYIFDTDCTLNIPLCSNKANRLNLGLRVMSIKAKYYKKYPRQSFHIFRHPDLNQAICCWAEDFVRSKPILWDSYMGKILVWQSPREKSCYGRGYESTIEDFVLGKLKQEGIL